MIPHSKPWITPADVEAVERALGSGMIGNGSRVAELESSLSRWVGCEDGVAVGSGSAAVLLALLGVGIEPGDDVVMPTYVCSSVLEAVITAGARPLLCDVGSEWVVTPADVERVITRETKAIIVPHMYGIFAGVSEFRAFGRPVIEDCAQAVGPAGCIQFRVTLECSRFTRRSA
jgi:dTDP-4-amino-4,6-dideoxygalactose transaminase